MVKQHGEMVLHQMYGAEAHEYINEHLKQSPKNYPTNFTAKYQNLMYYSLKGTTVTV